MNSGYGSASIGARRRWPQFLGMLMSVAIVMAGTAGHAASQRRLVLLLSFHGVHNNIGGDFDGHTYLVSSEEFFFVPKLKNDYGYGGSVGLGTALRTWTYEVEIGGHRTTHETSWQGFEMQGATFDEIFVDARFKPNTAPIRPFLLVGASFMTLIVKEGSVLSNGWIADDCYQSGGLRVGIGMDLLLIPHVNLSFASVYRWTRFSKVDGWYLTEVEDAVSASGVCLMAALQFRFTLKTYGGSSGSR